MNFIQKQAFGGLTGTFYKAYTQGFNTVKQEKNLMDSKEFLQKISPAKGRLAKKVKGKLFDTVGTGLYQTYVYGHQCAATGKQLMDKKEFQKNFLNGFKKGVSGGLIKPKKEVN